MTRMSRVSKNPVVPAKVKQAFAVISDDPKATLQSAAEAVGMTTARLRTALRLPHVKAWIAQERRAQLTELIAGNPAALKEIRDKSANDMARLGAVKTSELLHEAFENPQRPGFAGQVTAPGLVVVIAHADGTQQAFPPPPAPQLVELNPVDGMRRPLQREP
jgi:hypothetical protein